MALSMGEVRSAIVYNQRRSFEVELVRRIQLTVGALPDGSFGPKTVQAVAAFQQREALRVDGKVGAETLRRLREVWADRGIPVLSPNEIRRALRYDRSRPYPPDLIRKIQQTVSAPESGEFDAETVLAVAAWQTDHDLIADGMVGPNTLAALKRAWQPAMAHRSYRIHPAIGIARIGDSPMEHFVGPEVPGQVTPEEPVHRDQHGFIKRQAARFRVYEYAHDAAGRLLDVREVTQADAQIHWSVHLANRKAASATFPPSDGPRRNASVEEASLVIDAGAQTVAGSDQHVPLQGAFLGGAVRLGDLRTDSQGRLLVLGGHGVSRSPAGRELTGFANNEGWHDDVGDGPVSATVVLPSGETFQADPAWVVVAPPRYAPEIHNVVTWWDLAYEVAVLLDTSLAVNRVSFSEHVYPILARTAKLAWVSGTARFGHGPASRWNFLSGEMLQRLSSASMEERPLRQSIYESLRRASGGGTMPVLHRGIDPDNPASMRAPTLTTQQLHCMEQWMLGAFIADASSATAPRALSDLPPALQPSALDRAALEACIGGPFYPGIEASYLIARRDTYRAPFRIALHFPPGALTAGLAVPWQADFHACDERWWPAQRPVSVYRQGAANPSAWIDTTFVSAAELVTAWSELGFIRQDGERYVERERLLAEPNA